MSATIETANDRMTEPFREKVLRKCGESMEMKQLFFSKYADALDKMSRALARRFESGGRLFVAGNGGSLCDALTSRSNSITRSSKSASLFPPSRS
jgi:phosphoheptose isomerase